MASISSNSFTRNTVHKIKKQNKNKTKSQQKQLDQGTAQFFNGFCYLALIAPELRSDAMNELGAWPTASAIDDFIDGDWERYSNEKVGLSLVPYPKSDSLLVAYHVTMGQVFPSEALGTIAPEARVGGTEVDPADADLLPPPPNPEFGNFVDEPANPNNPNPDPPADPEPEVPGPDNPNTRYDYITVGSAVADQPDAQSRVVGMMEWDQPDMSGRGETSAGLFSKTGTPDDWNASLYPKMESSVPQFDRLADSIEGYGSIPVGNLTIETAWGYGQYNEIHLAAKPFYVDPRSVPFWTSDAKKETLDTSAKQILYDAPVSITPSGQATAVSSLLTPGARTLFQTRIGDHSITNQYFGNMLSMSGLGDSHLAALTLAYTRMIAARCIDEQSVTITIEFEAEEFDDYLLPVDNTVSNIYKKVATAANNAQHDNLVFLPPNATFGDVTVMAYLLGLGRTTARVPSGDPKKKEKHVVYSPFDRFCSRQGFSIVPIIKGDAFTGRYAGHTTVDLSVRQCEAVLASYVDYHGLWSQMAKARAFAFMLVGSPHTASLASLPKPNHTTDMALGLHGRANVAKRPFGIVHPTESLMSVVSAVTITARASEEVLLEAIIFTAESAGYSPFAPSFKAVVDQFLGESLPWGMSHAVIPVFSKLFNINCNDLVLCIDRHMVGCISKLLIGFKNRVYRATSYLALNEEPNSRELLAIHKKSVRDEIAKRRNITEREGRVMGYLNQTMHATNGNRLFYQDVYSDELANDRSYFRAGENLNRYQTRFMVEDPVIWEIKVTGDGLAVESVVHKVQQPTGAPAELTGFEALIEHLAKTGNICELDEDDYRNMARPGFPVLVPDSKADDIQMPLQEPPSERRSLKTPSSILTKKDYNEQYGRKKPQVEDEVTPTAKQSSPKQREKKTTPVVTPSKEKGWKFVTGSRSMNSKRASREEVFTGSQIFPAGLLEVEDARESVTIERPGVHVPSTDSLPKRKKEVKSKRVAKSVHWEKEAQEYNKKYRMLRKTSDRTFIEKLDFGRITDDEKKRIDSLYPRGHDSEIRRAPYTVGNVLKHFSEEGDLSVVEKKEMRHRLITGIGGKNAWMVSCLITVYGQTLSPSAWAEIVDVGFLDTSYEHWNAKFSSYNDILRNRWSQGTFQHTHSDFPQMLYISTLVGRPNREVDWDAEDEKRKKKMPEIKCRMGDLMQQLSPAQLKNRIRKMFEIEGELKVRPVQGFEDMYRTRYQWMIGGSMSGEKTVVDTEPAMKKKLEESGFQAPHHSTKKHIAEKVSYEEISAVLDMQPINLAKGHTKGNENGKLRAIYGSLFSQYVIGRYWSYHIEQNTTFKSASMNKPNSQLLSEAEDRAAVCARGDWVVCLDYTDFNASHSLKLLRTIIEVATEWAISKGFVPNEEFLRISDWYAKSFENSWYLNPQSSQWVQVLSGLFSGLPQTTFDNTVANLTYDQCYFDSLRQVGINISPTSRYVLGDDGWVSFRTKEEADLYLTAAKMGGIETNEIKQLVSKGRGEYLRLLYDNDGVIRGSPLRALANICHGSVESSTPSVGKTRIQELHSNISVLVRRGFKRGRMHTMFEDLSNYELNGKEVKHIDVRNLLYGTKDTGGLSLIPIDDVSYNSSKRREQDMPLQEHNDQDEIAKAITSVDGQRKFKSSVDFVTKIEDRYRVVWKHKGKNNAMAMLAARNAVEGAQDTRYEHAILRVQAQNAKVDVQRLQAGFSWAEQESTFNLSAADIEKLFSKAVANDDRVLSTLSPYIRIIRYMSDTYREEFISRLAAETGVTTTTIRAAIKSLAALGGENVEYLPTPYLSQELLGVLSKWRTVTQFTGERKHLDPQWIVDMSKRHKY